MKSLLYSTRVVFKQEFTEKAQTQTFISTGTHMDTTHEDEEH